ncbi:MAG: hypothetical protein IJ849_08895 [Selenomonadaceae bacterium]|nr:hypothetical protein [Selenomonadaceae bacterium]
MSTCYRVRFFLSSPLCFAGNKDIRPLMLDAILAYQWMRQNGHYKTAAENIAQNLIFPELPLERVGKCYGASAMVIPQEAVYMAQDGYVRPADWEFALARHTPKFSLRYGDSSIFASGPLRAYLEPQWLMSMPYVDFYANVIDETAFKKLLQAAVRGGFLGSKRSAGYGRIAKCTLKIISEGNPRWGFYKDGKPTRPLPVADFADQLPQDTTRGRATYFAPYWFAPNEAECFLPPTEQYLPILPTNDEAIAQILKEDWEKYQAEVKAKDAAGKKDKKSQRSRSSRQKGV